MFSGIIEEFATVVGIRKDRENFDFTRLFKNKTMMTPAQYREMKNEENAQAAEAQADVQPEKHPVEPETDDYEIID